MKAKFPFVFIAVLLMACGTMAFAQQQQDDPMMKAMMAYATPGPAQKAMQGMVGTWDANVKSYMDPSKPPVESKATSTYTSLMDGRYLQENVDGNMMEMPFKGMGIYGYDNATKQYVGTWIDNMGTGIMTNVGTSTDNGKTINYTGKATDPMTGKLTTYRSVMHNISADSAHFEMYGPGPGGKEAKMMEITYTRRK